MRKKIISTAKGLVSLSPPAQAVRAENFIYVSGKIPVDPASMKEVSEDFSIQARTVLE